MDCPRCGATAVSTRDCPRCGVVLAKALGARPRPPARRPPPAAAWRSLALPAIGLVLLVVAAVMHLGRGRVAAPASPAPLALEPASPIVAAVPLPAPTHVEAPPPEASAAEPLARSAEADRQAAARLAERVRGRTPLSAEDLRTAEDLFARHPAPARGLLEGVLVAAAGDLRDRRRYDAAAELLLRARAVAPSSPAPPKALMAVRLESGEWHAAEAAARDVLALAPGDAEAARGLAYALVRQDRSPEAIELLAAFVEARPDPEARALLERVRRDRGSEASLDEARLAHFHVRYDGEAHEDVGREILRVLERHYATLVRAFDHQPVEPIPVVLLSRESYLDATGAPAWSGGEYDSFDGRVRLPIGGLTAGLASGLDEAVVHELTHAFVADISRGVAPREIHEGLAQLMEGKRTESLLGPDGLRALADGRIAGVRGYYVSALSFVEDLVAQRGQGGINDLLRTMAGTGRADEAFRRVYGKDPEGLRRDWSVRLRQRYGS